jgi:acyl dehydratase
MLSATTPLYEQLKSLHGEQDIFFILPLESGMTVTPHGTIVGIRRRPTGTAVILNLQTRNDDGVLVNEHFTTLYFAGVECGALETGSDAPEHRLPPEISAAEPIARVITPTDVDQPIRYSRASGDTGAYHLDLQAALDAGLPGIIMHGMCTFAMVGSAVLADVAESDITRLRRLAVRFSHPVIPGETLETRIWRLESSRGSAYGFETVNPEGSRVVSNGRVELL